MINAETLADAIMKMAEEDKGLVKSKLVEMLKVATRPLMSLDLQDDLARPMLGPPNLKRETRIHLGLVTIFIGLLRFKSYQRCKVTER